MTFSQSGRQYSTYITLRTMDRWVGRVAIVTGASAGIGVAIARLLAEHGMKVVAVARREVKIKVLAAELVNIKGELHAMKCDITNEEDILRVVKWTRDNLGGADVLVNNAGVYRTAVLSSTVTTEDIRTILETNVVGTTVFTREVLKDMKSRDVDDGHIFHIGSTAGQGLLDVPTSYMYAGSKHALRVLTEGLRRELRDLKSKIKVTGISPGVVRTEIGVASGLMTDEQAKQMYEVIPSLEPIDVAEALVYALGTPAHVQVHEITIKPIGEQQ